MIRQFSHCGPGAMLGLSLNVSAPLAADWEVRSGQGHHQNNSVVFIEKAVSRAIQIADRALLTQLKQYATVRPPIKPFASQLALLREQNNQKQSSQKQNTCADKVKDMGVFLKTPGFGSELRQGSQKTRVRVNRASVYKSQHWINEHIREGDFFYLDTFHLNHIEVFDVKGKARAVLNLDGSLNIEKTSAALKQGRMISK